MMPPDPWPKPITFTTDPGPNFLWHVLAVAKIGYDSEYALYYRHTIDEADLQFLQDSKSLLVFGEGEGGDLSGFFTTLPAWLNLRTCADFEKYFQVLDTALTRQNLQPVIVAYSNADWTDPFVSGVAEQPTLPPEISDLRKTAARLADIYLRGLETYYQSVWPDAELAMRQRAAQLNDFFSETDYIAGWEQLLRIEFAADQYTFCLCYANKNGPDYNSLGYSRNLIYYDKPLTRTRQFVSHEIGTHLLISVFLRLAASGVYERRRLYSAYESLAMFYNRIILGVKELDYSIPQMNDRWHLDIYSRTYRERIGPEELLLEALTRGPQTSSDHPTV